MSKKFQRKIEDFTCEHCGAEIKGDGYTDHCPHCLWGKHVDINPGDRANTCGGELEPIWAEAKRDNYNIGYRCQKCGQTLHNRSHKDDDFSTILKIVENNIRQTFYTGGQK